MYALYLSELPRRSSMAAKTGIFQKGHFARQRYRPTGPCRSHHGFPSLLLGAGSGGGQRSGRQWQTPAICSVHHGWGNWGGQLFRDRLSSRIDDQPVAVAPNTLPAPYKDWKSSSAAPGNPSGQIPPTARATNPVLRHYRCFEYSQRLRTSRLHHEKGGLASSRPAMTSVAVDCPLHLTIAGRGPVTSELARAVEASDWLHLVTSPSDQELDRLYLQSDVFVLTTRAAAREGARRRGIRDCIGGGSACGLTRHCTCLWGIR